MRRTTLSTYNQYSYKLFWLYSIAFAKQRPQQPIAWNTGNMSSSHVIV
jgi:hypothetical protein